MTEVINIDNLSKLYKRKIKREARKRNEDFWALRDISLSIKQGEVLGIVGKNGAGKSTLLKILSKITAPTRGKITIYGRVGSLLEVGTGFHPEMTGRENIYMNGNLLGMCNAEINRKLDEIIEFSGVADFIETPVKRYSSGMQTRLAFAVAAHLEPEILIIDEVLAVGDAEFQKKCLGKIGDISNSGKTILFVSHNMNAIKNLCNRCIWLKNGSIVEDSYDVRYLVSRYLRDTIANSKETVWLNDDSTVKIKESKYIHFNKFRLLAANGDDVEFNLHGDDNIYIGIEFTCNYKNTDLQVGFALYDSYMNLVFMSYHNDSHACIQKPFTIGENNIKVKLPLDILNDGDYTLQLIAGIRGVEPILSRTDSSITISFSISGNYKRANTWDYKRPSIIAPVLEWERA